MKKEGFSAPQYLVAAAKRAAKLDEGNDFSRWIVAAIREKLEHDEPGLMAKMRAEMQGAAGAAAGAGDYVQPAPKMLMAAEPGAQNVTNSLDSRPFVALSLEDMRRQVVEMEARVKAEIERQKEKKGPHV